MIPLPSLDSLREKPVPPTPIPLPPEIVIQHIGKNGRDILWIAFAVFVIATLLMGLMANRYEKRHQLFHLLLILVTVVASLSYYAMAVGSGYNYANIGTHTRDGRVIDIYRQIFWVRYLDWAITTPLLLLCLSLIAGIPWVNIIALLFADEAMILTGLFAAFHPGRGAAKWGWFVFSCIFLLYVLFELLYTGFKVCRNRHPSLFKLYAPLSIYTAILWVMYPFFFALTQATGKLSVDWEVTLFAILDILSKVGFGLWLLLVHSPTSRDAYAARFPEYFVEERGTTTGPIQLPGEGE